MVNNIVIVNIIIGSSFHERVPTNGTRGVELEPRVNAVTMKVVAALRQHP